MNERERTTLLFLVASAIGLYTYRELERRQGLEERRQEERRRYVDGEISRLSDGELGHRERSVGVQNLGRTVVGVASFAVAVTTVIALLATHSLG